MADEEFVCYWAGFLIERHSIKVETESAEEVIDSIQKRLDVGEIIFKHVGVSNKLTEMCIDRIDSGGRHSRMCDLKKK